MRHCTLHRPSTAHCGGQHAAAERLQLGRRIRHRKEHRELAAQLGCGRGRLLQRSLAGRRIHEVDPHSAETDPCHQAVPLRPEAAPQGSKKPQIDLVHPYTVFNLYAQTISLNKLNFFGLGNDSTLAGASVFGHAANHRRWNAIKPVYEWSAIKKLNLALLGEINGRFVNIRGENGQSSPSIETIYTNATAPGLTSQPAFVQFGEGVRIKP